MPRLVLAAVAVLVLALPLPGRAAPVAEDFSHRFAAAEALAAKNDPRAIGLLRELLQEQPADARLCFRYGYALIVQALALPEGKDRRALIREGRECLVKAKAGGEDDPLVDDALQRFNPDGSSNRGAPLASDAKVNTIMQEAEKAFAAGDPAKALRGYREALKLDPTNYNATLWTGDAYFAQDKYKDAIPWFEKASALKPDRETAHRYRADALVHLGRMDEAIDAYIAAVVAEPYSRLPLRRFMDAVVQMGYHPGFRARHLPVAALEVKGTNVKLSLSPQANALEVAYGITRSGWIAEHRKGAAEKLPYRQSLAEETAGLKALVAAYLAAKADPAHPDAVPAEYATDVADLAEISAAGLLEPHLLYALANADLAQDYAAYRDGHRAELARYLREFFLGRK